MLTDKEIAEALALCERLGSTFTVTVWDDDKNCYVEEEVAFLPRALRQLQKAMRVVEAANLFCDDDTDTRLRALRDALAAMEED